jgi:cobalt-zinc-cadmium efflux system membrane fusion protein
MALAHNIRRIPLALVLSCAAILSGCGNDGSGAGNHPAPVLPAEVTENGSRIVFPPSNPGVSTIIAQEVRNGSATIPAVAPAHVVASISAGMATKRRIVLFESADITSLYSQYTQNRSNIERTRKNLDRVREMFSNQAANAKDLNEAEAEATNAVTSMSESEAKLRGLGFNPVKLDEAMPGTIWLICDVLESQLREVQQGEDVPIVFSAFPETVMHGRADAIGEVVDPVTRTVKVRVSASNPQGRILPGMFARVDFGDPINDVIVIPLSAVVTVEGTDYAFLQTGEREFRRCPIVLASSGPTAAVVTKGISSGDRVVTEGAMLLKGLSFGY